MILLTSTTDKLQVITSSTANIDVYVSYVDLASGTTVSAGRLNTKIATGAGEDVSTQLPRFWERVRSTGSVTLMDGG